MDSLVKYTSFWKALLKIDSILHAESMENVLKWKGNELKCIFIPLGNSS